MRRRGAVCAIILVLAAFIVWGVQDRSGRKQETPQAVRAPAVTMQWPAGSGARYEVDVRSTITTGASADAPVPSMLHLTGILNMRVLSSDATQALAALRIRPVSCDILGEFRPEMCERLSLPFYALFARNGEIVSVRSPSALSENERIVLEEMLRAAQIVVSGESETWITIEEHKTGTYEARYERTPDGSIRKCKTRYLSLASPVSVDVLSSDTLARLSPTLWLASAAGRETLAASSGGAPLLHTDLSFSFRLISGEPDIPTTLTALAAIEASSRAALPPSVSPAAGVPSGGATNATSSSKPSSGKENPVSRDFSAALDRFDRRNRATFDDLLVRLREHPELARDVAARLLAPGTDDATQAALVDLLGTSDTPTAQEVLLDIAGNPDASHMNALRAIIALGGVAHPTAEARDGLWSIARREGGENVADLSRTALLALGAVASTLRQSEDAAARSVVDDLLRAVPGTEGPDLRVALKALGNTGDPAAAGRIQSYLASENAATRAAAATALRRMPDARTGELLLSSLANERAPEVRSAVVRSMSQRGLDDNAVTALAESAPKEQSVVVRGEMIRALAKGAGSFPTARETLQHMLETEQDTQNLDLLRRVLSKAPKTP